MKVYGDTNSGNCLKVKWVCDHLALPYTWIAVDTLKGETRTAEFLKLNGAGQVPAIELDDGRTLAQSNAIIRYLARGSHLIPQDAFAEGKMDEWLFWEQYSHEPYIAVCRFQMFYLKKPAADRLAELLGVPVSPRTLEGWDIPYVVVNGRVRYVEEVLEAAAAARLAAAPRRTGRVKRHPE